MNRGVYARLAKLEAARHVDPLILHFEDGNKAPMTIKGSAANFFRLAEAIAAYNRPPVLLQGAFLELDLLRRATRIEGHNAQLFALAQALVKGPAPDDTEPQP